MSANFMRGGSDVIGMGHSLAIGILLLILLAEPAMAVQPESPWLYLSIAPDQVVSARSAHPDSSPNLIPSNLVGQLPRAPDKVMSEAAASNRELIAQSVACLTVGGLASAATFMAGWQSVTNLISGGGSVPGATPGVVALGVFGVVFTSFCAIGQALTPLYLHYLPEPPPAVPPSPEPPASNPGCTTCAPSVLLPGALKVRAGQALKPGFQGLRVSATACGAGVAPLVLQPNVC